jgi:formamidopyrimidine-DNA glycosylase
MPELPDIDLYVHQLGERVRNETLLTIRISTPFLVRSVDPPLSDAHGRQVTTLRRIGKRIAIGLTPDYWLVLHLMVAGRLQWSSKSPTIAARNRLAAFDFSSGHLLLTEAGHKKRASLFLVRGDASLAEHDPGGIEPLQCTAEQFAGRLRAGNHTLKRALTDPHLLSGIGNAYSDEILHAARLSPVALTATLSAADMKRLFDATRTTLSTWQQRLRDECGREFPLKVTAFRDGMAVHGRYRKPCPVCASPIQRIRYKDRETNYCARCQTSGKILADRSLSRLLKDSWPGALD